MSWTRKTALVAFATLLPLVFGLLLLELIFGGWLRGYDPWRDVARMNVIRDVRVRYDVRLVYGDRLPSISYSRDHYGLRGKCEHIEDIQVVSIGGSTTDQRVIADGHTWQDALQEALRADPGPRSLCVTNAGVDGHSTFGHTLALERWFPLIPGFQPRLYLLYIGINDAPLRFTASPEFDWAIENSKPGLKDKSAFYDLLRIVRHVVFGDTTVAYAGHRPVMPRDDEYVATRPTPGIEPLVTRNAAGFERRLDRMIALIRERGGVPMCVSQPSVTYRRDGDGWRGVENIFRLDDKSYNGLDFRLSILALNEVMQRRCPAAGGYYVDLESAPFPREDFYDLVHMLPSGSAKVGKLMYEAIKSQGMLHASLAGTSPLG